MILKYNIWSCKMDSKTRDRRTNNEPLLLYCNMDAGHGGASGRFEAYKETAMEYAFFISLLKIKYERINETPYNYNLNFIFM